jgi:hypothetical protein
VLALRPTKLYSDIPALDVPGLGESLTECAQAALEQGRGFSAEIADHWQRRALRTCPEWRKEYAGANREHATTPVGGVGHFESFSRYTPDTYISKLKATSVPRIPTFSTISVNGRLQSAPARRLGNRHGRVWVELRPTTIKPLAFELEGR